ncbi:MAG: hypothetical protein WCJ33_03245 [Pseudomonadota bacterium]
MKAEAIIFEKLPMKIKKLAHVSADDYSVISKSGETIDIKANTAYEAFKISGLKQAIKIERKSSLKPIILNRKNFVEEEKIEKSEEQENSTDYLEQIMRSRNPIISANDMDIIMRNFSNDALTEIEVTDPKGLEVHNDGFDEIIPSKNFNKNAPLKKIVDSDIEPTQPEISIEIEAKDNELAEEQTSELENKKPLSQEEIEKLLSGE